MQAELLFLGTGGSSGIPLIACSCPVCTSDDPYNKRLRPSVLISTAQKRVLIDAGPDFRSQALRYHINKLDGLLLTHSHFDHIGGLDELRIYYILQGRSLPVLLSEPTYRDLRRRYDYLFQERNPKGSLTAQFDFHILSDKKGAIDFLGYQIGYFSYEQVGMPVLGFRFGNLAYVSDIRTYPENLFEELHGIEILILSALRSRSSIMHFTFQEAIEFAKKTEAQEIYFTHMSHDVEHHATQKRLPQGFYLAYDGLKFNFEL